VQADRQKKKDKGGSFGTGKAEPINDGEWGSAHIRIHLVTGDLGNDERLMGQDRSKGENGSDMGVRRAKKRVGNGTTQAPGI